MTLEKVSFFFKFGQLGLVLLVLILEIVQVVTYSQFVRKNAEYDSVEDYISVTIFGASPKLDPSEMYFKDSSHGKGPAVIWVYIVVIISLLGIIGSIALSQCRKNRNQAAFIAFNLIFMFLWFTEVFTNLVWVYKGSESICAHVNSDPDISVYFPELKTLCETYITSNIIGWFVLISFAVGAGLSYKVLKDNEKTSASQNINGNMTQQQAQPQDAPA